MERVIDATRYHGPASAPGLIRRATEIVGSQKGLAERLGVTPRFLRMVASRERSMDYGLQVMLETIIDAGE